MKYPHFSTVSLFKPERQVYESTPEASRAPFLSLEGNAETPDSAAKKGNLGFIFEAAAVQLRINDAKTNPNKVIVAAANEAQTRLDYLRRQDTLDLPTKKQKLAEIDRILLDKRMDAETRAYRLGLEQTGLKDEKVKLVRSAQDSIDEYLKGLNASALSPEAQKKFAGAKENAMRQIAGLLDKSLGIPSQAPTIKDDLAVLETGLKAIKDKLPAAQKDVGKIVEDCKLQLITTMALYRSETPEESKKALETIVQSSISAVKANGDLNGFQQLTRQSGIKAISDKAVAQLSTTKDPGLRALLIIDANTRIKAVVDAPAPEKPGGKPDAKSPGPGKVPRAPNA